MIPQEIIDEITSRIDMLELLQFYKIKVKRTNATYAVAICPFHDDHDNAVI